MSEILLGCDFNIHEDISTILTNGQVKEVYLAEEVIDDSILVWNVGQSDFLIAKIFSTEGLLLVDIYIDLKSLDMYYGIESLVHFRKDVNTLKSIKTENGIGILYETDSENFAWSYIFNLNYLSVDYKKLYILVF